MNRYELHQSQSVRTNMPLSFDGCQVQSIITALFKPVDESTAWRIGHAIARHIRRQTHVRYHDHRRRAQPWHPLNEDLHRKLNP